MTSMTGDQTPPAGWYPDPNPGADAPAGQQRYWDGSAWTERTTTAPTGPADQQAPRDGLGLAAFVLGVIGLILIFFIPVGFLGSGIVGIIGLILGFLGRGRARRGEATNGRTALWGIILSSLAVAISVIAAARLVADPGEADLGEEASQETAPPGVEVVNVFDLEVGDCLTEIRASKKNRQRPDGAVLGAAQRGDIRRCDPSRGVTSPGDEAIVTPRQKKFASGNSRASSDCLMRNRFLSSIIVAPGGGVGRRRTRCRSARSPTRTATRPERLLAPTAETGLGSRCFVVRERGLEHLPRQCIGVVPSSSIRALTCAFPVERGRPSHLISRFAAPSVSNPIARSVSKAAPTGAPTPAEASTVHLL